MGFALLALAPSPAAATTPDQALAALSPEARAWVNASCPRVIGPALWSDCVMREAPAAAAGKPDLSMLSAEQRRWVVASCPDVTGPSLTIDCMKRETAAVRESPTDVSGLTAEQRAWIAQSCPTVIGPSLHRDCVAREAGALRGMGSSTAPAVGQPSTPKIPAAALRRGIARPAPGPRASNVYEIEVAHDDEFFVINGEKFESKTYCLGWEEGDQVRFLEGSPFGACASAQLLNLRTRDTCDVWCE